MEAARLDGEPLELAREHGLDPLLADVSNNLGYTALQTGDLPRARALLHESIGSARRRNDSIVLSVALSNLVLADLIEDRLTDAARECAEALEIARRHALGPALRGALACAAALMAREGSYRESVAAQGSVEELGTRVGEPLQALEAELCERALGMARDDLGDDETEAVLARGRPSDPDDVAGEALAWLNGCTARRI